MGNGLIQIYGNRNNLYFGHGKILLLTLVCHETKLLCRGVNVCKKTATENIFMVTYLCVGCQTLKDQLIPMPR